MTLTVVAPTDAQLDYIRSLCRNAEQPLPDVIASKDEAARIIDELKAGRYLPDNYRYDTAFGWQEPAL
jgi:hypothetical protein